MDPAVGGLVVGLLVVVVVGGCTTLRSSLPPKNPNKCSPVGRPAVGKGTKSIATRVRLHYRPAVRQTKRRKRRLRKGSQIPE